MKKTRKKKKKKKEEEIDSGGSLEYLYLLVLSCVHCAVCCVQKCVLSDNTDIISRIIAAVEAVGHNLLSWTRHFYIINHEMPSVFVSWIDIQY